MATEVLWREAQRQSFWACGSLARRLRDTECTLGRLRAQRLQLPAASIERVQRYEAHLQRMLAATLGELVRYRTSSSLPGTVGGQ